MLLSRNIKIFPLLVIFLLGFVAWFWGPIPEGISNQGWHILIIFVLTMIGIMMEIIPLCGTLFLSLLIASLTGTIDLKTNGFTGFSNVVCWLLFFVIALSKSITQSTIGIRIAYFFMKLFGKNMIGLAYSISITELTLSTILPSNTARTASVGLPVVTSLAKCIGNSLGKTVEKLAGSFLTIIYTTSNSICSAAFLTAMISNAIIADIAEKQGLHLTWLSWAKYISIPAIIILFIMPLAIYVLLRPKNIDITEVRKETAIKSKELGPLTTKEKIVILVFCGMLLMWILSGIINVSIITTTLIGIIIFLLFGIFSVKDILSDHSAISAIMTLGILISYATCLGEYGVIDWVNSNVQNFVVMFPESFRLIVLASIYYFSHYFFSGEGCKIVALYLPFVITGIALGIDKVQLIVTLSAFSAFSAMLTHYSAPSDIMMFNNGYVSAKKWMKVGFILSVIVIILWFSIINITM